MGEKRVISEKICVYHLIARVVQRRRLLADVQREVWAGALRRAAVFSGVEVITYCCLQNHFHILVRIDPAAKACDDAELVRRFRALYGSAKAMWCGLDAAGLAHALAHDPPETAERLRERLRARMGNVSEFMRTLRQRYTMWFNKTYDTVGTLWAERFTSVLVQDTPWLVGLVAAYIDLNPVRAGLAALPEDYRWSGYAAALGGGDAELRGALAACFPGEGGEDGALARYRLLMLGKGAVSKRDGTGARIDPAALAKAAASGGELEAHELLRLRARFFTRGKALGTEAWLRGGAGAAALSRLRKPPVPRPVEMLRHTELAVAGGASGVEAPLSATES
ncbi:MAG: transposase [Opitutales bacterium]|nr:transposase [Opitutales bacterium]